MKIVKKILISWLMLLLVCVNFFTFNPAFAQTPASDVDYNYILDNTAAGWMLGQQLTIDGPEWKWAAAVNNWIVQMIWYLINIFVVIGIAVAFIWGYVIMTSDKEDKYKDWIKLIAFWIIGVIVMVSAKWIANVLVTDMSTDVAWENWLQWLLLANHIYENLAYPLIKIILYLVVGILFFIMAGKVVTFILSTDDAVKKKAWWIILRTVIWILIIMWSKQVVESVMWNQESIFSEGNIQTIGDIGNDTLEFGTIPIVAQIINWVMWLAMFVVLLLIIIQTYRMLFKPDDSKNAERIKKTLLYVVIWVLVIWASYIISNVLIVK